MATERLARLPLGHNAAAYAAALRAWRLAAVGALHRQDLHRWLIGTDRADLTVYGAAALAFLVTGLPFWLASADGATVGFTGVPAPGVWDSLGRAQAFLLESPFSIVPGRGPFSPLWTWLLAVPYAVVGWTGVSVVAVAKLLAWCLSLAGAIAIYNLAANASGQRWPGVLALALIALDPALALGRVSGSEEPLVAALAAFAALAAVRGRSQLLKWLLAGLMLARPDGVLLVALALGVLAVELFWRGGDLSRAPAGDLALLAGLALPAVIALGAWSLFGLVADGSPLPSLWPDAGGGAGLPAARGLWSGFLSLHPSFASGFASATVVAWAWAAVVFGRAWGARGAFPALVPMAIVLSVASNGPNAGGAWSYDARRLVEPALPWLALALALALAAAGQFIWERSGAGMPPVVRRLPMARVLACVPLLFWLLSAGMLWLRSIDDYGRGAREVAQLPRAAGQWLAANAPAGARIGITPGAEPVRGTDRRATRELAPDAVGSWDLARTRAQEQGLAFMVAYRGTAPADWPVAREILRLASPRSVAVPRSELAVYRLDWSLPRLDRRAPTSLNVQGFTVLDELDVGDDASETRHLYSSASRGQKLRAESAAPNGWFDDDGRAQELGRGAESFQLAARPGQNLLVGVRYANAARGTIRLDAGGESVELRLRDCGYTLCEDAAVVLPAGRVKANSVRVNVAFASGEAGRLATFHYWSLAKG